MCSVVGYIGTKPSKAIVLEGLARLEYRGYDSAGFACLTPSDHRVVCEKAEGALSNLLHRLERNPIDGFSGIGHTRWSTHGVTSVKNAHPHFDCHKTVSLVHNGIVENHHELRGQLTKAGHIFSSDTDTEVIAHLFEAFLASHTSINEALVALVNRLEGAYAFVALLQDFPDIMIAVRKRSPLCIGVAKDGMIVASDLLAFAGRTNEVIFLPDESFAVMTQSSVQLYDFMGNALPNNVQKVDVDWSAHEKNGHEHFMLKEIYEQKSAIHATLRFLNTISPRITDHLGLTTQQIKALNSLTLIGSGTSWHAGRIAQFFFETVCMLPTKVGLASEFRHMPFFPDRHGLYCAISQSGETADTLESLRFINSMHLPTVALTNVASSTMVRETGGFLLTQAGAEVAVASTKAFATQVTALYWLAHRIALEKGIINQAQLATAEEELLVAAEVLENCIENYKFEIVNTLGKRYAQYSRFIFLGRHVSYPFALEAALKLKEISYLFAQCYPAGELKHGPLALVDAQTPVFIFSHQSDLLYQKLLSNAQEVKARGGHVVAFAFEGQHELIALADQVFIIPKVNPLLGPLAMTGLMQFFVYQIAKELGRPIDKPRNLAKSVTVE